jgi:AcrR family transcriptional regulator
VPRLWSETIEAHRREVGDAILDKTAALVSRHGLRAVTMSQIAEETGIGRATLYKYYPHVEAILVAWHERLISGHLKQLAALRGQPGSPLERLEAVLSTHALIRHEHHGTELEALLHRDEHIAHAQRHLSELIRGLLVEGVKAGEVRKDVSPEELATYCLHALGAAGSLLSRTAVQRLVRITLDGLTGPARRATVKVRAPAVPG